MLNLKGVCVLLREENECISSTALVCEFKWGSWRKHIYMLLAQKCDLENGGGSLMDLIDCFECVYQCIIKPRVYGEKEHKHTRLAFRNWIALRVRFDVS